MDRCKFPTDEITGAQNFNFVFKFPQNGRLLFHILYFWKQFSLMG